ncbi:MAG: aldehyde dehydrogenase family protein [Hyphomicrobiales bacterium]
MSSSSNISPQTPLTADIAGEAFAAAGVPEGVFQTLDIAHADAERMIASGRLRAVNFIGSVNGGKRVHAAAGGTLTNVHLELGGKDPSYVRPDADIARAIPLLVEGCYPISGQSCCSVERLYVHEDIRDRFIDASW